MTRRGPDTPDLRTTLRAGVPEGERFRLEHVVVVSAYGGDGFFSALARQLKPRQVDVVLDQSAPVELVRDTTKRIGKRLRTLRVARANQLMHAKVYYLRWRSPDRARDVHVFHWGSANASESGFGGGFDGSKGNAECMAWARVFPGARRHRRLFEWIRRIAESQGDTHVPSVALDLAVGVHLDLPTLRLADAQATRSFDAWLQRGRLCHKYEVDPSFLRLTVQLKTPLPTAEVARVLISADLVPDTGPRQLRWNYLQVAHDQEQTQGAWRWRAQHFVDSNIGYWTSGACFDALGKHFSAANSDLRERELDRVRTDVAGKEGAWVERLLEKIHGVYGQFDEIDRSRYFHTRNGVLDEERYRESARRQLALDVKKARDPVFRSQYVQRFVFPRVPWFRADRDNWEDFASSVAEAIWLQLHKSRVSNALARVVRDQLDSLAFDGEPVERADDLLDYLRENWDSLVDDAEEALIAGFDYGD